MAEILHQLRCVKPCKDWDNLPIYRIYTYNIYNIYQLLNAGFLVAINITVTYITFSPIVFSRLVHLKKDPFLDQKDIFSFGNHDSF